MIGKNPNREMIILPSAYLPPVSYFTHLIGGDCTIDIGEHYLKRSIRNRAQIMTAQGVMNLTIPVKGANKLRQPMHSIMIDYSKEWQHQHWMAILSAYKSSPYFEHYAPYFEPLYRCETKYLVEFNEAIMEIIYRLLPIEKLARPTISELYVEPSTTSLDLRPKGVVDQGFIAQEYIQVFSDRLPFHANLSILDLLMCEGTTARGFLGVTQR